jgi:hypothetical protein
MSRMLGSALASLRAGRFEPRPRDCGFCHYRSLGRVEAHDEPPHDDVAAAGTVPGVSSG